MFALAPPAGGARGGWPPLIWIRGEVAPPSWPPLIWVILEVAPPRFGPDPSPAGDFFYSFEVK